jgi:hypothetical protein
VELSEQKGIGRLPNPDRDLIDDDKRNLFRTAR